MRDFQMEYARKCMLIDDDPDDHEIFLMALEVADLGIECICANDGREALQILASDPFLIPEFIYIDMNMPEMNGMECLAELVKMERLSTVPKYLYSTSADPKMIEKSKSLGATGFVIKPTSVEEFARLLAMHK